MESNRSCEVLWSKFGRNIEVELALEPERRKPAEDFMNICRAEYDGLIEQSPTIDDDIIKQFKIRFEDEDISKPDICNGLDKCTIYKGPNNSNAVNILAQAGAKLSKNQKWKDITETKVIHHEHKPNQEKEVNKKEMKHLSSLGKGLCF